MSNLGMILLPVALAIVCVILLFYFIMTKIQLRKIQQELKETRQEDYNRQITISLFDHEMENIVTEFNKNLDYQTELKHLASESEHKMRQSISDIAHDLRTPLTVVKGNLQMIAREGNLSDSQMEYLKISQDKADELKEMVDDFFELSLLESDSKPVEVQRLNLTEFLVQFLIEQEAVIRQHQLEPEVRLPKKAIYIMADESLLRRMLNNLLNNTLKYAKKIFYLGLEEDVEQGTCKLLFSNPVEEGEQFDVSQLFQRTYKGSQARNGKGAGLGLYIVKLLAEKQKATVEAHVENQELVFTVTFSV